MSGGSDPTWLDYLELAVAAMIASLSRGASWRDPKTDAFSWSLFVQSMATAGTIAIMAAAAQQQWGFSVPVTAFMAVVGSLIGIPFFVAWFRLIGNAVVQAWLASKGEPPAS